MEHAVFEATIGEYRSRLTKILRRFRIPEEDAEDLLQEAFVSLYVHWDAVREPCGYLITSVNRLCLRYQRKRRRRQTFGMDEVVLELLADPLPPSQEQFEARHDTRQLLGRLTVKQRRALYLRRILEMTPREILLSTGMEVTTTRRLVQSAIDTLARKVIEARAPKPTPAVKVKRGRGRPRKSVG